jgi:hypothetical protein
MNNTQGVFNRCFPSLLRVSLSCPHEVAKRGDIRGQVGSAIDKISAGNSHSLARDGKERRSPMFLHTANVASLCSRNATGPGSLVPPFTEPAAAESHRLLAAGSLAPSEFQNRTLVMMAKALGSR